MKIKIKPNRIRKKTYINNQKTEDKVKNTIYLFHVIFL